MTATGLQPYLNTREESTFNFLGVPTVMRSTRETTNGAYGLMEHWVMPPGFASPYHTHHLEDEAFYVLEGEIAFVCGGRWVRGGPGAYVFGPREIPHGFKVVGDAPARMLLMCAPAGFEHFVLELAEPLTNPPSPPDMARLAAVAAKYRIDLHGPLPEQPEESGSPLAPAVMLPSDLKTLNLRWIQAFNERDWETEAAVRGSNFQAYLSGAAEPLHAGAWSAFMIDFTNAFPDACITVNACIAEGDTVVSRWTLTGTHRGSFNGIPSTGRAVQFTGIEFNRVAGGRIAEHWSQFDLAGLLRQIGAM